MRARAHHVGGRGADGFLADGIVGPIHSSTAPHEPETVGSGSTSWPVELRVEKTGDEQVFFVEVRAIKHPTSQVGDEDHAYAATEFSDTPDGDYGDQLGLFDELPTGGYHPLLGAMGRPRGRTGRGGRMGP